MKHLNECSSSFFINLLRTIKYKAFKALIILFQSAEKLLLAVLDTAPETTQKAIKKLKDIYHNQETLDLLSITYLITAGYLTFNYALYIRNTGIIIISLLCSVTLLAYGCIRYKDEVKATLGNAVIKWVVTAFIYTCCFLLARFTFNINYKITPENLNYSIIGYAAFLTLPITALLFGFAVYAYIYIRNTSLIVLFFSSLLSLYLAIYFFKEIVLNNNIVQLCIFALLVLILYQLASIIFPRSGGKSGLNEILKGMTLLSVAVSLIFIGVTSLVFIENNKNYFLFLDANVFTSCNKQGSHDLYIRKNNDDCYKLKLTASKDVELIPIENVGL